MKIHVDRLWTLWKVIAFWSHYNNIKEKLQLKEKKDSLKHRLRLDGWVIWAEVLVLFHLLLEREQLFLQPVSKSGQSLADVIAKLLVQHLLQVRRAHAIGNMAVRGMTEKENKSDYF